MEIKHKIRAERYYIKFKPHVDTLVKIESTSEKINNSIASDPKKWKGSHWLFFINKYRKNGYK